MVGRSDHANMPSFARPLHLRPKISRHFQKKKTEKSSNFSKVIFKPKKNAPKSRSRRDFVRFSNSAPHFPAGRPKKPRSRRRRGQNRWAKGRKDTSDGGRFGRQRGDRRRCERGDRPGDGKRARIPTPNGGLFGTRSARNRLDERRAVYAQFDGNA